MTTHVDGRVPPSLSYPTTTEYSLLMNRFKLLSLVQRVAHRDVLDMIETVGLEALSFKGVSLAPSTEAAAARGPGFPTAAATPPRAATATRLHRRVRRATPSGAPAAASRAERAEAAVERPVIRRTRVVRSEEQERAFYSRLAAPKRPITAEPIVEEFIIYDNRNNNNNNYTNNKDDEAPGERHVMHNRRANTSERRRQPQRQPQRHYREAHGYDDRSLTASADRSATAMPREGREEDSSTATPPPLHRSAAAAHAQDPLRSLAPKSKPRPAPSDEVPFEAIQQAAFIVAQEKQRQQQQQQQLVNVSSGSARRGSRHSKDSSVPPGTVPMAAPPPQEQESGAGVLTLGGHSLEELARAVDNMLRDHETILRQAVKDESAAGVVRQQRRQQIEQVLDRTTGGTLEASGSSGGGGEPSGARSQLSDGETDELLLYSRLTHKISQMDAEMERIIEAHARRPAADGEAAAETTAAAPPGVAPPVHITTGTSAAAGGAVRKRARGSMPAAVVARLVSSQKETHEYICYNERLWNTCPVSQYVFAQRLTNAIFEDCFEEVLAEVGGIMDEYVEGLAEHEMQ